MFLRTAPAPQTSSAQAESLLPGGIVDPAEQAADAAMREGLPDRHPLVLVLGERQAREPSGDICCDHLQRRSPRSVTDSPKRERA
jgi:hypothetical protein